MLNPVVEWFFGVDALFFDRSVMRIWRPGSKDEEHWIKKPNPKDPPEGHASESS